MHPQLTAAADQQAFEQVKAQVFAVIMPNHDDLSDRWQEYQTSVSEIERNTLNLRVEKLILEARIEN